MTLTIAELKKLIANVPEDTEVWCGTVKRGRFAIKPVNRVAEPDTLAVEAPYFSLLFDERSV